MDDSYLLQIVQYTYNIPIEARNLTDLTDYKWYTYELYRRGEWTLGLSESWGRPSYFQEEDRKRTHRERMKEEIDLSRKDEGYIGSE